jgi:hypothetical protein
MRSQFILVSRGWQEVSPSCPQMIVYIYHHLQVQLFSTKNICLETKYHNSVQIELGVYITVD